MVCERCSVCGSSIQSHFLCSFVSDGGQSYESCFCICEECRRYMVERGDFTLWEPHSA